MVPSEFEGKSCRWKWQGLRQSFGIGTRDMEKILLYVFGNDRPLIHLHDVSIAVDQERSRKDKVAMPIEQLPIHEVVHGGDVIGSAQDGKSKSATAHGAFDTIGSFFALRGINRQTGNVDR